MTTAFTANLGLSNQGTGDNSNTWGVTLNGNNTSLDSILGSTFSVSVAGSSDYTLSSTNALNLKHTLTGVLTGSINYIFPASAGRFVVINNTTTGSFTVTVKQSGGTGIVVPQGKIAFLILDANGTTAANALNWLATIALGTASSANGALTFYNSTNGNTFTLQPGATGSNLTFTLPTADGSSGQSLQTNGSGVLSFGSGSSGAMTLLSTQTIISSTASVSVTSGIDNTYSHYIWEISNLTTVSNAVNGLITVKQGGVFVGGTSYLQQGFAVIGASFNGYQLTGGAAFNATSNSGSINSSGGGVPSTIRFEFWNPANASSLDVIFESIGGATGSYSKGGGTVNTVSATTGIKFAPSSGNIATCVANLYGVT